MQENGDPNFATTALFHNRTHALCSTPWVEFPFHTLGHEPRHGRRPPENRHKKDTRSALVDSCQHVGRGFQAFVMPLELEEVRQSATTAGLHDIYFNEASRVV